MRLPRSVTFDSLGNATAAWISIATRSKSYGDEKNHAEDRKQKTITKSPYHKSRHLPTADSLAETGGNVHSALPEIVKWQTCEKAKHTCSFG